MEHTEQIAGEVAGKVVGEGVGEGVGEVVSREITPSDMTPAGIRPASAAAAGGSLVEGAGVEVRRPALRASAPLFAALGDETRLTIIERLANGAPRSISALTAGTGVTRQAVTKHLHVLGGAGLVRSLRQGRECLWEIEPSALAAARHTLDQVAQRWDPALARLAVAVEASSNFPR